MNDENKVDVTFTTGEATNEFLKNKIIPIIYMNESEIKDDKRTYYYNINGKMEPDYESMCAYLLDESILFVGSAIDKCYKQECTGTNGILLTQFHYHRIKEEGLNDE